jgi:hypothetical protein
MEPSTTTLQIQGPVVVLPLEEYLEQKAQLEEYRRLRAIYEPERAERFRQLLKIAERNRQIPIEQVEADVIETVRTIRE